MNHTHKSGEECAICAGKPVIKVWISKYALSQGIWERDAEISERQPQLAILRNFGRLDEMYHGEGREWHRTREDAERRAEEMRLAKIASLRKQIAKLERMRFGQTDTAA
jgi:hypothetical protein